MTTNKLIACLAACMILVVQHVQAKQVSVELRASGVNSVPSKVTLFQDTVAVASESFRTMKFTLPDVAFNRLKLEAQNYKDVYLDYNHNDTLLIVYMQRDTTVQLKEVVVRATTTMKTEGTSTKYLNVAEGYLGTFHSGMETLEWTPGLMRINGAITVPGRGVPLIYVDNRRLSSQKELNSILSKDISSIEIIREPGGEYPPGTTSVIKIKMKKHLHDYVSLSPNVRYTQRSHNAGIATALNANFKFNKVSGELSAEYSHGGSRPSSTSSTIVDNLETKQHAEEYNTTNDTRYRSNDVQVFAGMSYDINSKSRLQAQYSGSFEHGNTRTHTAIETLLPSYMLQSYMSKERSRNRAHNVGMGYYLDAEKTTLSMRVAYNDIHRNLDNTLSANGTATPAIISNPVHYKAWVTYAELQQQLGKGALSAGYTGTFSSNSNNYITNNVGRLADVTNDVLSSYVNYSHDIKSVNLSGGLAYTHYYLKCKDDDAEPFSKRYDMVLPSAAIKWNIKGKSLTLSYKRSGYAPPYYQLNPNVEFIDSLNYYVGNLNLHHTKSNNLSLSFGQLKNFTTSLEYTWRNNQTVDSYTPYDKVKNAILTQPCNGGKYNEVAYNLTYGMWQRKYNVFATSILTWSRNRYPFLGGIDTQHQLNWLLMLNARYTIAGKYDLFTNSWYQSPRRFGNQRMGHTLGANVGISASYFKDKLQVTLAGYDLLNKSVSPSSSRTYSNNVTRYSRFDYDGRCVSLSITYTFNTVRTSFERDDSSDEYTRRTESR